MISQSKVRGENDDGIYNEPVLRVRITRHIVICFTYIRLTFSVQIEANSLHE